MADRNMIFTWQLSEFNTALQQSNLFTLRQDFSNRGYPLSRSVLIWENIGTAGSWMLIDFVNKKNYYIDRKKDTEEIEIYEVITEDINRQGPPLNYTIYGTLEGLVDWLKLFDLDEIDIEALKRTDLSSRKLTFEYIHPDLLSVYEALQTILNSPRESLLGLSKPDIEQIKNNLQNFVNTTSKIKDFHSQNTREEHTKILEQTFNFCDQVKQQLKQITAYLNSERAAQVEVRLIKQIETQVNDLVSDPVEKLRSGIELSQKQREEAEEDITDRKKDLDDLKKQMVDSIASKTVSQYKTIFAEQTQKHQRAAWIWLGVASVLIGGLVIGILFYGLLDVLNLGGTELTGVLQNIFKKGSALTLFYFAINRSIKNYTAQKHLEIVNRHRQNALETFDEFRAASGDNQETRDAVLLAATNAIFDANQTGYLSTKTKGSENTNPIQQVVKAVMPGSSSTKSEN